MSKKLTFEVQEYRSTVSKYQESKLLRWNRQQNQTSRSQEKLFRKLSRGL